MERLVTRQEVRKLGINVSNTQFLRYEKLGLIQAVKIGQFRSAVVRYRVSEIEQLLSGRTSDRKS